MTSRRAVPSVKGVTGRRRCSRYRLSMVSVWLLREVLTDSVTEAIVTGNLNVPGLSNSRNRLGALCFPLLRRMTGRYQLPDVETFPSEQSADLLAFSDRRRFSGDHPRAGSLDLHQAEMIRRRFRTDQATIATSVGAGRDRSSWSIHRATDSMSLLTWSTRYRTASDPQQHDELSRCVSGRVRRSRCGRSPDSITAGQHEQRERIGS